MRRPPLTATARLLRTAGGALSLVVKTWGALLSTAVGGLIGPPIQAVLSAARTVRELLVPIWKVQGSQSYSTSLHYLPFQSERLELIASSWRACSIPTCLQPARTICHPFSASYDSPLSSAWRSQVAKLSITGPAAAVVSAVRYLASCLQAIWAPVIAGAHLAPSVQQSAMEAGSQVICSNVLHIVKKTIQHNASLTS